MFSSRKYQPFRNYFTCTIFYIPILDTSKQNSITERIKFFLTDVDHYGYISWYHQHPYPQYSSYTSQYCLLQVLLLVQALYNVYSNNLYINLIFLRLQIFRTHHPDFYLPFSLYRRNEINPIELLRIPMKDLPA